MPKQQKIRTPLAEIAQTLRTLRGLTTTELARQLQLDRPNLSAWFGGRPQVLSEANELKICAHLGWRFDQLITSHVHMWRLASEQELKLLQPFLKRIAGSPQHRLVIEAAGFEGTLVGHLLYVAQQDAEGTLIRLRRASQTKLSIEAMTTALCFGEKAPGRSITKDEYEALWIDESASLPLEDYVARYLPDDGTTSALNYASRGRTTESLSERSRQHVPNDMDDDAHSYVSPDSPFLRTLAHKTAWLKFASRCEVEGFSVQDAMRWKAEALKTK